MPFQIDHMETAIEVASGQPGEAARREAAQEQAPAQAPRAAMADAVGEILSAELERFLKLRGLS